MASSVKAPKFGFVSSIIPDAWLFKLKSLGSRSVKRRGTLNTPMITPVVTSCKTPGSQITVSSESPSSLFDRLTTYNRSTALSLKNMHKLGGDQFPRRLSSSTNETTRGSRDPPWSFAYPSGTDTTNVSSFELGIRKNRSMWSTTSDSEATFNGETENGNVSDTQSVLRARILAAERLREGSNFSSREHKKKDNLTSKREESTAQLDSVKSVLEQRRQKSLLLEEEELQQACCRLSTHGSPALGAHNTPVFESFLEVSAKGRSLNLPAGATRVRVDDSSTSSARELHCINVESPSQTTTPQDMTIIRNELHGLVKESVAVVKSSYDPYKDFRESMIEMIVEKDVQETGDLEELLQCYLSLNEVEYHTVIVNVFTDVWRELFGNYS
ncbi:unnamed protein product [Sphagnum troendelagicum]|uniref:Transcription repressor n=1 Tax=Sphagnum troendelagicum TaxID=128251 RepID=A0ABP0TJ03_9BRYO